MSTIVFSNQSSIFLLYCSIKFKRTLDQKIAVVPHIVINRGIVLANIAPAVMPKAKDLDKTAKFVTAIRLVIKTFDDEIGSLQQAT